MDERIAVDLGRGREEEDGPLGLGQTERLVRPQRADLEGLDRKFQVVDRRSGTGKVKDRVERPVHVDIVRHVVLDKREARVPDVGDVGHVAGDEVVHADHLVAVREEPVGQVRPDEAGDARNQDPHYDFLPWDISPAPTAPALPEPSSPRPTPTYSNPISAILRGS